MYDNILVPTDGSEQATNAVKEALTLVNELDAKLHALYVVSEFEGRIPPITGEQEGLSEEYHEYGEEIVGEVSKAADAVGVDCTAAVADGVVHTEIESYVENNDIDLIVIGSRGLSNIEKAILGSTTDKIVRTLDIPTTVVHQTPESFVDMDREVHLDGW